MFDQQPSSPLDRMRSVVGSFAFVAQVGAVSVEVFLHKRIGQRYCRLQAFMVVALGMIYAGLWQLQGYDQRPFVMFLVAFVIAAVMAQVAAFIRGRRGDHEHTQYSGWPLILREASAHREVFFKQVVEPLLVLVIGMLVNDENRPLGVWLMFAAACLFVSNSLSRLAQKRRVDDMRDAVFVQQQTAGQFRGT